jgi:hypothetical protein
MNYEVKIKTVEGANESYYYSDSSTTQGGETVYRGNIVARAYWYDETGASWWNTPIAEIGDTTPAAGKYSSFTLYGTYIDLNLDEIESKQYTLGDAWYRAEDTVFESLRSYAGCVEERDCFRGYMPEDVNQLPTQANVWSINSGNSTQFEIDRLSSDNALWCSLRNNLTIESLWETREKAMRFAGMVECWLKETGNMQETDNVTWCRLLELPDQPTPEVSGKMPGVIIWRLMISLEIIYKTESIYT